jgi:hypothetical protein
MQLDTGYGYEELLRRVSWHWGRTISAMVRREYLHVFLCTWVVASMIWDARPFFMLCVHRIAFYDIALSRIRGKPKLSKAFVL